MNWKKIPILTYWNSFIGGKCGLNVLYLYLIRLNPQLLTCGRHAINCFFYQPTEIQSSDPMEITSIYDIQLNHCTWILQKTGQIYDPSVCHCVFPASRTFLNSFYTLGKYIFLLLF
jgi:hypothetical protein